MYFLKCNNCGHFNAVKSEYLTFCARCDKKLDNNFLVWKKRNPGKTFEEYKKAVCLTEEAIEIKPIEKPKSKRRGLMLVVGFLLVFGFFYGIGKYGGELVAGLFKVEKTPEEVLTREWVKKTYGNYGLSIEMPFEMTRGDIAVPKNVRQLIEQMDVYKYDAGNGFEVIVNSLKYNSVIGAVDIEGAADGSVSEMRKQKGVTDFDYTQESVEKNGVPGFVQRGNYKANGIDVEFINAGFSQELVFYQVMVGWRVVDSVGGEVAQRVIESIEFKDKK